jgi:hypothetical protein
MRCGRSTFTRQPGEQQNGAKQWREHKPHHKRNASQLFRTLLPALRVIAWDIG